MNRHRKLSFVLFTLTLVLPTICRAIPLFEYELWMQAQTSLDQGSLEIHGRIVNTGTVALDLTRYWGALAGLPSHLNDTTCGLSCVHEQLAGVILYPGSTLDIVWLSGTQEQDLSRRAGALLEGSLGFIPYGSDWHWAQGGYLPELQVSSEWVNGPADPTTPFNNVVINLDVAGQYIESTPLISVPEPSSILLLLSGLIALVFWKRRLLLSTSPT